MNLLEIADALEINPSYLLEKTDTKLRFNL
jgi:hypothetical protein